MQDILQACLEELEQGRSVEQCLAQYPEDAALLEPLLQTALSVGGRLPRTVPVAAQEEDRSNAISQALDRLDRHLAALDAVVKDKLQREPAAPAVMDAGFLEALGRVAVGQDSARVTLEETLGQAPIDIQNSLGVSLEAIQQARERVRAALESALPPGSGDGR